MKNDLDPATYRDPSTGWEMIQLRSGRWVPIIAGAEGDPAPEGGEGKPGTETPAPTGGEGDPPKPDESKTFTQDQVNALIAREVDQAKRGKLDPKELGFDSAKGMKDWIDSQKTAAKEAQTDAEKAIEEAKTEAAKEATEGVLSKANSRLIKAEFKVEAKDAGVEWIEDAFAIAQQLESWSGVEVDDDGNVSGIDKAFFEKLKEDKPFLFQAAGGEGGKPPPNSRDAGASAGGSRDGTPLTRREELEKTYPVLGRLRAGNR